MRLRVLCRMRMWNTPKSGEPRHFSAQKRVVPPRSLRRKSSECANLGPQSRAGNLLPLHDRTGIGKPSAEYDHQNVVSDLESAGAIPFIERDSHCGRGGVSVTIEIHLKFRERNVQPTGQGLDDPEVCLVRNDAGEIIDGKAALLQRAIRRRQYGGHGLFEGFATVHMKGVKP